MQLIQMILALANTMVILDKWISKLSLEYAKKQKEQGNVEFLKSLEDVHKGDVRGIAANIGGMLDD